MISFFDGGKRRASADPDSVLSAKQYADFTKRIDDKFGIILRDTGFFSENCQKLQVIKAKQTGPEAASSAKDYAVKSNKGGFVAEGVQASIDKLHRHEADTAPEGPAPAA